MGILEILRDAQAQRSRPAAPPNVVEHAPAADDHDTIAGGAAIEPQDCTIDYVDSRGEASCRTITVSAVEHNNAGNIVLKAHCHVRDAPRAFRLDRVSSVTDMDGEVFEDPAAYFANIFDLDEAPACVPPPRGQRLPSDSKGRRNRLRNRALLYSRILVGIARSDGKYERRQEEPIAQFIEQHIADQPLDGDDKQWLRAYLRRMNPSFDHIEDALDQMAPYFRIVRQTKDPDGELAAFANAIRALIMFDGHADEREMEILRDLVEMME
ncbi:MAG: WYL domain-containing protein [Pseudomonadota bacterium]